MVKQRYVPYCDWEDFKNGMWRRVSKIEEAKFLEAAIEFTRDFVRYGEAMGEVIEAWPKTMINNLSNKSINRKAFLGHCAVSFKLNCPEYITRLAWSELSFKQQIYANKEADKHIKKWEFEFQRKDRTLHKNV